MHQHHPGPDDTDLARPDVPSELERMVAALGETLEHLPIAICICDLNGTIVQYNRHALEIWARTPAPGETHQHFTAGSRFYRADGQLLSPPEVPMAKALRTELPVREQEITVERQDGSRVVTVVNINPLKDSQGALLGAVNCFRDITDRKRIAEALKRSQEDLREQEQRLAATYEHAAIGIAEIAGDGRFLRVNESICAITGQSRETLLSSRLFDRTHPDDRAADQELYNKQVSGEIGNYSIEKRFMRRDGRVVWMAVQSTSVRDADGRFLYGVRVVQDVTERKQAEERQQLLIDELNHRVKNTLASVQSLFWLTARGGPSPQAFREAFQGRLIALSQAHDQLTRRHWESASLNDIIAVGTGPYYGDGHGKVVLQGQGVTLKPRAALTLAMAFYELTTNAVKYGALSAASGTVEIAWSVVRPDVPKSPMLRIEWREAGGPPVNPPARRGFGSTFIERSVATELEGAATIDFDPKGLRCSLAIPAKAFA